MRVPIMKFVIEGGKKLEGEIQLSGAKNAATKMMVASLLTGEPCVLRNVPQIGDVQITAELCQNIGAKISHENNTLEIQTAEIANSRVVSLSRRNRIPILALAPLLARVGEAEVPILGGDKIGPRPIDIHIGALTAMGAEINMGSDSYVARAKNGLKGAEISLRFPSVGATENTILAAVLAKGRTIIRNAAVEPEVIDLIKMLQKMGAIIELGANRLIYIDGVEKLRGAAHEVMPDRNEAVSFACLAVATDGRVLVRGARQDDLITFLNALRKAGGEYEITKEGIVFRREGKLRGINIETGTHPGFMTDWQQPFAALLTRAEGQSKIHETIYEDRFGYADDLNSMGANIKILAECLGENLCRFANVSRHSAFIYGPTELKPANLQVRDLRSGMAHLIAALIAKGVSTVEGVAEIDRGYEKIDERLRRLGANIQRIE